MNLTYFIDNTNKFHINKLPEGKACTVEELYNNVISINLPKLETVKKWHKLLIDYIDDEQAVFFIRRYSSAPKKDWTLIRRGFLTEYPNGLKYVFCDNYFATAPHPAT